MKYFLLLSEEAFLLKKSYNHKKKQRLCQIHVVQNYEQHHPAEILRIKKKIAM